MTETKTTTEDETPDVPCDRCGKLSECYIGAERDDGSRYEGRDGTIAGPNDIGPCVTCLETWLAGTKQTDAIDATGHQCSGWCMRHEEDWFSVGSPGRRADADNRDRLRTAFPELWQKYAAMAPTRGRGE